MGLIMTKWYTFHITNSRNPAIKKMSPTLKRYNIAWSPSANHCPLPDTFQIGDAGWKLEGMPTDGITPLFSNVTKAFEVIPNTMKNPPIVLA
jgi:hypothetical protein